MTVHLVDSDLENNGNTWLHWAVLHEDIKAVQTLLTTRNPEEINTMHRTALHIAALIGNAEILTLLLQAAQKRKSYVNARDFNEETALHLAAQAGHENALKVLLKTGANLAAKNKDDMTAKQLAAKKGYTQIVRYLTQSASTQPPDVFRSYS